MINRRTALKAAVAAPAILWWSALDAACSRPAWPGTGNLSSQATLPDPFLLDFPLNLNATQRVATKAQWTRRHTQIISAAQHYIWGHMPPPAPVAVVSRFTGTKINGGNPGSQPQPGPPYQTIAGIHSRTVNLVTGPNLSQPGGNLPFQINVYWPVTQGGAFPNGTSGSGPWPVLLASEKSYSPVADNSGSSSEDASIGAANVAALVQRGYCIAEYGQDDFSQDTSDYVGNPPLTKIFTQGFPPGVYPMYPNDFNAGVTGYDWGMWAAHGWGFSRVIDYLVTQPFIDATKIAIQGHSRANGGGLMCGITDQRVALTIEAQSGLWGPIRPANGQSNGIPNTTTFGAPGWFCANAAQFGVSNAAALQLPFDLHEVRACLAPPAHFRIISTQWPGETPLLNNCAYHNAEAQVLLALTGGVDTKKLGVYFDNANTFGDGHEVTLSFWTAMIDYMDFSFFGLNTRSAAAVNSAFSTPYDYTTIGYPPYAAAGSPTNRTWTTPNLVGT